MPMAVPDTVSLTRLVLTVLVFLYSLAHLLLAIVASLAWTSAQRFVGSHECWLGGREYCGFVRWGLYLFISIASLVSCVTAAGMGAAGMRALSLPSTSASRYTSPAPGLASSFDPAYILRGVLLTLAFLAPLVYLGWQDVTVVAPESLEAHMNTTANGTIPMHRPFEGLSGVFILEMMDKSSMLTHVAFILTHFNLAFGALLAGIAAAMAPSTTGLPALPVSPPSAVPLDRRREPTMHGPMANGV